MRALSRKLLRDLRQLWSQVGTIALVVGCGMGALLTCLSAVDSLAWARDNYYAQSRFADVFVDLERAPRAILSTLNSLPGIAWTQASTEKLVRITLPGVTDPIVGRLIGYDTHQPPPLNQVTVQQGYPLASDTPARLPPGAIPAWVSAGFARAHGLSVGAQVRALMNGRERTLVIQGALFSPEYVFAGMTGMPDLRGFGVFWLDERDMAAAWNMRGAFNRLAVRLAPGAAATSVMTSLDQAFIPYGGRTAYDRSEHVSHTMLDNEIREQRVLGTVLPVIFVAIASFLLNAVVARLVSTQREQIATLAALGYSHAAIARHYLGLVSVIVALGWFIGLALGHVLGAQLTALYGDFFQIPTLRYRLAPGLIGMSLLLAGATAVVGAWGAVRRVLRLAPAIAMQPPVPHRYRPARLEAVLPRSIGPHGRMMLRQMARRPWRTLWAIMGVASAMALVIMGTFVRDAIAHIEHTVFDVALRADVMVWLTEASDASLGNALARLPGVIALEPGRDIWVRLGHGHQTKRVNLQGWPEQPHLRRIVAVDGTLAAPSGEGLVLTDRLADSLGVRVGDTVRIDTLEGAPRTRHLVVAQTVREMMGTNAYLALPALHRLLGEGNRVTRFALALERGCETAFLAAAQLQPRLAGTFSKATLARNMHDISSRNIRIMSTVMTAFAMVIAIGVVYNDARITLAEHAWELASLRVMGLTRGEVSGVLLGELSLRMALALPLGMLLGLLLVHGVAGLLKSDQFFFPVVIQPRTHALAALTVLAAGAVSALLVRRRIDQLDLIAVLKIRA